MLHAAHVACPAACGGLKEAVWILDLGPGSSGCGCCRSCGICLARGSSQVGGREGNLEIQSIVPGRSHRDCMTPAASHTTLASHALFPAMPIPISRMYKRLRVGCMSFVGQGSFRRSSVPHPAHPAFCFLRNPAP